MKRVLITGGAGFIGSHLAERLLDEGDHCVTVLDSFDDFYDPRVKRRNVAAALARGEKGARYLLVEGDIRDERIVGALFAENRFDQVVHIAARAGVRPSIEQPLLYESVNCQGTLVLLEAMRRNGVKELVFASSSSVYGENPKVPFSETDPVNRPISPYAATKRSNELTIATYNHLYGINAACLRFFTVYGPRQRPDLAIAKFTKLIDEGRPIPVFGDGNARRDFTYVDDIIQGVRAAMQRCSGYEIYNLGESATTPVSELIAMIEDAVGKKAVIDRKPAQPGDVPITYADISKAQAGLDYRPTTKIAEGVKKYVAWYKQQHE
jgi:UDP-glucuronate 4-epimerase